MLTFPTPGMKVRYTGTSTIALQQGEEFRVVTAEPTPIGQVVVERDGDRYPWGIGPENLEMAE